MKYGKLFPYSRAQESNGYCTLPFNFEMCTVFFVVVACFVYLLDVGFSLSTQLTRTSARIEIYIGGGGGDAAEATDF